MLDVRTSTFFAKVLTSKIKRILGAIKKLREGEYGYRMQINGRDEISSLGNEFNDLSVRDPDLDEVFMHFYEGEGR